MCAARGALARCGTCYVQCLTKGSAMKLLSGTSVRQVIPTKTSLTRALKPRSHYPSVSCVRLRSSPLQKLAWIFGFGRR